MPKKLLFVGNIANNAFLLGEILNEHGVTVDVMCDDYFHCMAYPEWEHEAFSVDENSQIKISQSNHRSHETYLRPKWFAQGNRIDVLDYLIEKNTTNDGNESTLWARLIEMSFNQVPQNPLSSNIEIQTEIPTQSIKRLFIYKILIHIKFLFKKLKNKFRIILLRVYYSWKRKFVLKIIKSSLLADKLIPLMPKKLLRVILRNFYGEDVCKKFDLLVTHYDYIILFGPSAIWSLISPESKYAFFEHGTVRFAQTEKGSLARLLERVYKTASLIFVTNGDTFDALEMVPKASLFPTIHPIKFSYESTFDSPENLLTYEIPGWQKIKMSGYLLCPIRQDWAHKGSDFYLQNLNKILETFPNIYILFTKWGQDLDQAIAQTMEVNNQNRIRWINTYSRIPLCVLMRHSTLVLDQMTLPHFGSTAPQALAVGAPVVSNYRSESTKKICEEPAPIYSIKNVHELIEAIAYYQVKKNRVEHEILATKWVEKYHSKVRLLSDFKILLGEKS